MKEYDVVILGGGLAYTGAELLRNAGLKVAIVEREEKSLGGVCLNRGCVPTKLYIKEAKTLYELKKSRLLQGDVSTDIKGLRESKERLVNKLREDIKKLLRGVDLIFGYGELVEPYTVKVGEQTLKAKHIIINTGKRQQEPPEGFITTDELLDLDYIPESISILGDDPILYEFACMFSLFGSKVKLYAREPDFMHPSIRTRFSRMLKDLGIDLHGEEEFKPSQVNLWAKKRLPNSECVKVDLAKDEAQHILVDNHYETSLKDHYAVGDVNGLCELAHASRIQALSVAKRIISNRGFYTPPHKIPYVLYTLPMSYAKVGLTKKELEERRLEYQELSTPLRPFAVGSIHHTEEGLITSYFDKKGFLVGAEVFCALAEEMISSVGVMFFSELDRDSLSKTPLPHPTLSEVINIRLAY